MWNKRIICIILLMLVTMPAQGQTFSWQGQLSSWGVLNFDDREHPHTGLRYIPSLHSEQAAGGNGLIDIEVSFNMYGSTAFGTDDGEYVRTNADPYRLWLRFSTAQFEERIGLQKINFGPARMLRPLMWFDTIDSRDPLQLTDGVWGGLVRYYLLNNANIWAWVLWGNGDPKGWEVLGSAEETPEFGGRVQVPIPAGEAALSYHHRRAAVNNLEKSLTGITRSRFMEDRYALDCRWDAAIGLWTEAAIIQQAVNTPFCSRKMINIGADYTIGLGNDLLVTAEHLLLQTSQSVWEKGDGNEFSGFSCNYSLGLLDAVTVMVYRDWENRSWYRFFNIQRTLDRWQFFVIAFWNPDRFQIYQNAAEENLFAGKGIQLIAVFNH